MVAIAVAMGLTAPAAAQAADLQLTDIADPTSFAQPVYVTSPPGDASRVFVVEQGGKILMVKGGVVTTFLDLTGQVNEVDESGLTSIAFAPDFATSGLFYVFYSDAKGTCTLQPDGTRWCDDRVDEFHADPPDADTADANSGREIISIPHHDAPGHHGGP